MSKLEELIWTLCPNGVEYKSVGDISTTLVPATKVKSHDYLLTGKYPVIDQGQDYIGGYTNNEGAFPKGEYIIFGDHTCVIKYVDFSFVQGADGVKVLVANLGILPKYLYYAMSNIKMNVGYTRHWSKMKCEQIPVPPMEVQCEIVRILDNFTELTAGLTAELTVRRQQYEYYRKKLLAFDGSLSKDSYKTLSNIAKIYRGVRVVKSELKEDGKYPVYQNCLTPMGYYDRCNRKADTTFVISAGAAGEIGYSNVDFWAADDCITFECDKQLRSRFLYHLLMSMQKQIFSQVRNASIPRLSREVLERLIIPVPPIYIQDRIISILDNFDSICSDFNIGLPAEITARKKQYEYYRDKLLTFKEYKG